ncbi:MAG: two-component system cell cycle sensor histidine kinase/response regulator CckA [Desulforhopalus sp.]|jgi:two-component system cell cycle sensor histidine kinase/response regulator CckA
MTSQTKIMIVDDNAIVAADIKARIGRMGYLVTECVSRGETAIESVKGEQPDLILMDIKLKGQLSGIEAAASIRSFYDIPVIFLSSYADEDTLQKAKLTDPYGYIVKPFDDSELRTVIELSLHKHGAERKLKKNEQWLRTILDSIGDGVIATDMEGIVTFVNPVAENLTGWSKIDAVGRPIVEVFNIINESTRQLVENPVDKVLQTGLVEGLANHTLLIRKDGHELPIKDSGSPIVLDKREHIGVVLVFQDDSSARIAEKKLMESEGKFKLLFEHAPLPYQSLDGKGVFLEVNRTWLEVMGYDRDEVVGKFFGDFLHPDWRTHYAENFPKFKSIGEVLGVEFEMCHKDGSYLTVRFDGRITKDALGGFVQTHCVFRDVTKEVALQRQVDAQEIAIRKNQKLEAMGTLAGGIAHDFNNILAAAIGYTELCFDETKPDSELFENLTEVLSACNRAKDLVKQILTFSRQGDEEKKPINICPLAKDAIKMLRSTTPANIELVDNLEDSRVIINGNVSQINQVIVNLVTNAVHAIRDNGRIDLGIDVVTFDTKRHERLLDVVPGKYAKISVADNGMGISNEHLHTIFDPYFTTKSPEKGTGLGLAVVHGIIKSHQGYVDVTSEPHKKTIFDVYLPLSEMGESCEAAREKVPTFGGNEHILVVDDEPALATIHQRNLERKGYSVTVFLDSRKALTAIETNPDRFDLVITDMTMPGVNGLQLAAAVKKIRPKMSVILCTGYSEDINQDTWQSSVLDALFMKPVENNKLALAVRELLDART